MNHEQNCRLCCYYIVLHIDEGKWQLSFSLLPRALFYHFIYIIRLELLGERICCMTYLDDRLSWAIAEDGVPGVYPQQSEHWSQEVTLSNVKYSAIKDYPEHKPSSTTGLAGISGLQNWSRIIAESGEKQQPVLTVIDLLNCVTAWLYL